MMVADSCHAESYRARTRPFSRCQGQIDALTHFGYTCATGPTPPAHDFVPAIGLQAAYSRKVPGWPPVRRRGVETSALQPSHSPDSPLRDFAAHDWPAGHVQPIGAGWFQTIEAVSSLVRYTCATGHLRCGALSVESIIVRAMTPDHSEGLQYHVLPTDDPLRALNILREAAGLPSWSDEHDDQGG